MTQKYAPDGAVVPVTKLLIKPCVVTQVKIQKSDGYTAIQVGFGSKKNLSKSIKGHLKKLGSFQYLKEFRVEPAQAESLKVGDVVAAETFEAGDTIQATGTSKGRGFQGVVKRHGFHGSPASHGHKDQLRMPGSVGATAPARIFKGMRMAGQMGDAQVSVKNLKIVEVDSVNNEIFIKGAIPGAKGNLVIVSGPGEIKLVQASKPAPVVTEEKIEEKIEAAPAETVVEEPKAPVPDKPTEVKE